MTISDINVVFYIAIFWKSSSLNFTRYIIQNIDRLPDKFFCMNGDLLLDIDMENFIKSAQNSPQKQAGTFPPKGDSKGVKLRAETGVRLRGEGDFLISVGPYQPLCSSEAYPNSRVCLRAPPKHNPPSPRSNPV